MNDTELTDVISALVKKYSDTESLKNFNRYDSVGGILDALSSQLKVLSGDFKGNNY